ncbi:hypothetical protein CMK13_06770 [Candidatus Poribacteria bacterium]|nr:hypothetical protein [Candidatus Poribacteria bacterium]OUT63480.1 MAG: hypothetical protein CBB75_06245 [bacterium TMED15]
MDFLIVIVLSIVLGLFMSFPNRFRHHFENWILSRPKPYVLYVLCFGYLGWTGYPIYKSIKGEEIGFRNFFSLEYFLLPLFLFPYLTYYLTSLIGKRLEIYLTDKKDKPNRTDYFKNKQQQQKE